MLSAILTGIDMEPLMASPLPTYCIFIAFKCSVISFSRFQFRGIIVSASRIASKPDAIQVTCLRFACFSRLGAEVLHHALVHLVRLAAAVHHPHQLPSPHT